MSEFFLDESPSYSMSPVRGFLRPDSLSDFFLKQHMQEQIHKVTIIFTKCHERIAVPVSVTQRCTYHVHKLLLLKASKLMRYVLHSVRNLYLTTIKFDECAYNLFSCSSELTQPHPFNRKDHLFSAKNEIHPSFLVILLCMPKLNSHFSFNIHYWSLW
jgi:uncharacterized CHY-type Zn-finger protein